MPMFSRAEPRDDDFHDIAGAAGNLQNARTAQEIVFNEAVTATHIRLVATSIYANGRTTVCGGKAHSCV